MVKQSKDSTVQNLSESSKDTQNESGVGAQSATTVDAISMLKADHDKVKQLFENFKMAERRADRARIVKEVCKELTIHAILEEEIFYPACRELMDDDPLDEAQVEHDSAKILIHELQSSVPEDAFYDAKFEVLSEQVKHHIQEEESKSDGIFAKAKEAGADLVALGAKMKERKAALQQQAVSRELHAKPLSFKSFAKLGQEEDMGSYQRGRDYNERGSREDQSSGRDRDERRRYMSDEEHGRGGRYEDDRDDYRRSRSNDDYRSSSRSSHQDDYSSRGQRMPERDENGRFMSDRDDERSSSSSRGRGYHDEQYSSRGRHMPERDENGRFMSEDDRGSSQSRGRDYEDDRRMSGGRHHGGLFGDSEGHAEAARKGWDEREGERRSSQRDDMRGSSSEYGGRRYASRGRDDEDERRHSGHGGWFGDPEGHSQASRRGWQHRG
jgi:hypothetical protein